MRAESDQSKTELILNDNVVKRPFLSNFIIFIPIYFLRNAHVSAIF